MLPVVIIIALLIGPVFPIVSVFPIFSVFPRFPVFPIFSVLPWVLPVVGTLLHWSVWLGILTNGSD